MYKKINNKINIFFILEQKNEDIEDILLKENIKNIIYINEININSFIYKLKNLKLSDEKKSINEIKFLKSVIEEKNKQLKNYESFIFYKNKKYELIIEDDDKNVYLIKKYKINKKIRKYYKKNEA